MHAAAVDCIKLRVTWWQWHNARIDILVSGVNFECGVRNNPTVRQLNTSCITWRADAYRLAIWFLVSTDIGLTCTILRCSPSRRLHTRESRQQRMQLLGLRSWMPLTASYGTFIPPATEVQPAAEVQHLQWLHPPQPANVRLAVVPASVLQLPHCRTSPGSTSSCRSKAGPVAGAPCRLPAH